MLAAGRGVRFGGRAPKALTPLRGRPLVAYAQQPMPVVGFLNGLSAGERPHLVESFRRGLSEVGYVAGQNVAVEYRHAENQPDRLRALAADLIARRVAVIAATGGNNSALVAKSLTTTIPIVFTSGVDPVRAGLVSSFSQPEGNVTGVSWFSVDLGAKHLELVREVVPAATLIAVRVIMQNDPHQIRFIDSIHVASSADVKIRF